MAADDAASSLIPGRHRCHGCCSVSASGAASARVTVASALFSFSSDSSMTVVTPPVSFTSAPTQQQRGAVAVVSAPCALFRSTLTARRIAFVSMASSLGGQPGMAIAGTDSSSVVPAAEGGVSPNRPQKPHHPTVAASLSLAASRPHLSLKNRPLSRLTQQISAQRHTRFSKRALISPLYTYM